MKSLVKDILTALLIGMVLPGIILNGLVAALERLEPLVPEASAREKDPEPALPSDPVPVHREGLTREAQMEPYLVGVVLAEMPASFATEALKAQAVAARTYAGKARLTGGKHKDGSVCTDSRCCQAYISPEDYLSKGGTEENLEKIRRAVFDTAGQVLCYEGELIEATYFSCSGGSTEDALEVWGTHVPYLQAVDSPGEESALWFRDQVSFSAEDFCRKLEISPEGLPESWFGETAYTDGGGVKSMEIGGTVFSGTELRERLGLRSTAFSIAIGRELTVTTRGYGHRVGMSQYGADAMAVLGSTYREILSHYYPGTGIWSLETFLTA